MFNLNDIVTFSGLILKPRAAPMFSYRVHLTTSADGHWNGLMMGEMGDGWLVDAAAVNEFWTLHTGRD